MKVYILSPHFDDAAYGLTITISQLLNKKISVTLINCFTITKWTALPVENKDVKSVSLLRATEDAEYNKLFNNAINIVNLDLLDAPLRNGYIFQSSSFAPNEWEIVEQLTTYLVQHVDGLLLCPLSIGGHIDHAICREAVGRLYSKLRVVFYEDLPYAQRINEEQLQQHIQLFQDDLCTSFVNRVSKLQHANIDKQMAISVYKSQINEEIRSEIIARMMAVQGERLWGEEQHLQLLPLHW